MLRPTELGESHRPGKNIWVKRFCSPRGEQKHWSLPLRWVSLGGAKPQNCANSSCPLPANIDSVPGVSQESGMRTVVPS